MIRLCVCCKNIRSSAERELDVELGEYLRRKLSDGVIEFFETDTGVSAQALFSWRMTFDCLDDSDAVIAVADALWDAYEHFLVMRTEKKAHQGLFVDISGESVKCTFSIADDVVDRLQLKEHLTALVRAMNAGLISLEDMSAVKGHVGRI
ncbi:MAG: hypothetical protein JXR78_09085 [Victivallales bacterium]|nr:hypothetical protein [Victivallales bacterium]